MSKKNFIFSAILLLAIVSVSYLSLSAVNTNNAIDNKQNEDNVEIFLNPKSSGYAVAERWNDTTVEIVNEVAVSADGKYMAVVTNWDATPGSDIFFYNNSDHDGIPMWSYDAAISFDSLAISADGSYIVAGSQASNLAYLFNNSVPESGNNKLPIWWLDPGVNVGSVDISADGNYIVAGVGSNVFVYNNSYPSTGFDKTAEYEWVNDTGSTVQSVAISSDGKYVVAGTNEVVGIDNVFFWNTTEYVYNQEQHPMWSYNTSTDMNSVAISFKGDHIVAGGNVQAAGDELFVFNKSADDGKPEWSHSLSDINVLSVAISEANGEYIAVGGHWTIDSGKVFFFNRSDYKSQPMWEYGTNSIAGSVAITADGEYIVAGTQYNLGFFDHLYLFNKSAEGVKKPEWSFEMDQHINSVSISSWGNYIAAGGTYTGGTGKAHLFYHARPIPGIYFGNGGGDDDDDDDKEGAIPFGNHYLLIMAIAIASLVIITKRKAVFSKK